MARKISLGARVHDVRLGTLAGGDCSYRLRDRSLAYPSENKCLLFLHGLKLKCFNLKNGNDM